MKKRLWAVFFGMLMLQLAVPVKAELLDYEGTINTYKQDNKKPQLFVADDGSGNAVWVVAKNDQAYVSAKNAVIRSNPGEAGTELKVAELGCELRRTAVCYNGWSKVTLQDGENKINGYIQDQMISDEKFITDVSDHVTASADCEILDFPGRKDGEVVGEILELDEIERTGTVEDIWSRILYLDAGGIQQTGYVPTSVLNVPDVSATVENDVVDMEVDAGTIHESEGTGVFAEAVDGIRDVDGTLSEADGVKVGAPVAVSASAALKNLGQFRITHYCQCSICCGPWANGITSTGVIATTNHTIAVDPTQIPYGSQVVINGQVYVAEDCGGAIKTNCIDIYVATHEEGESKGVFYTDVYLIQ